MTPWSEATQAAVKEALEILLCSDSYEIDCIGLEKAQRAFDLIRKEETSEKPIHHITRNGCSICGTDTMNCKIIKELRSIRQEEERHE